jgi:hypothetical protein
MTDHDELLALARHYRGDKGSTELIRDLAAALRAAEATWAEPDAVYEKVPAWVGIEDKRTHEITLVSSVSEAMFAVRRGDPFAVYRRIFPKPNAESVSGVAPAGSATPTRCHECDGRGHTWEFSRDGYMTCDWCGGSGEEPEAAAGSATPTEKQGCADSSLLAWGAHLLEAAGSAAPTEENDEFCPHGRHRDAPCGECTEDKLGVCNYFPLGDAPAGSATPTGDDDG